MLFALPLFAGDADLLLGGASLSTSYTNTDGTNANYQGKSFGGGVNYYFGKWGAVEFAVGARYESNNSDNTANTDSQMEFLEETVYAFGFRARLSRFLLGFDLESHEVKQISSGSFDTLLKYSYTAPSFHVGLELKILGIPTMVMMKSMSSTISADSTILNNDTPVSQTGYWLMINLPLK